MFAKTFRTGGPLSIHDLRRSVEEEEEIEGGGPRHRATSGEIIIESEIKGLSLLCPGGGSKRPREPERREGSSFYCLHPPSPLVPCILPPSTPLRACRATGRVNRQPNLDVSSRPRLPVGFSSGPRSCLHLYRITRTRLWSGSCVEGPDPLCSPLLHSFTVMAQVRSKVTGAGKVVSLFVSKMKLVRNRK